MLLILDSHPVQYRAPVYRRLQELCPDQFVVVYATDCSVKGHQDAGFGRHIAWDIPLLEGYPHEIISSERGVPLQGFRSLTGDGLRTLFKRVQPRAVLFTQFLYQYDFSGLLTAKSQGCELWMRQETQDEAIQRSSVKSWVRSQVYRGLYRQIDLAFYIGELNRMHLIKHGFSPHQLVRSPYVTVNELQNKMDSEILARRRAQRKRLSINDDAVVISFAGKLIAKKNPSLLLRAVAEFSEELRSRFRILFLGSGELHQELIDLAAKLGLSERCIFTGFVNQSQLTDHYLAADIMMLPSRRMGETWGLVVNEALQAGCRVVVTDAVGCHPEFSHLSGFRVIPVDDAVAASVAVAELADVPRSFDWARQTMSQYTVDVAARAIADQIERRLCQVSVN